MDRTLNCSPRSSNVVRVVLLAVALLVVLLASARRAGADPATPVPTLATAGPIGVGSVVSWNDPEPQPGYALVGASGGDEYTCPASYNGGTVDDDPDTVVTCDHRGAGTEYTVRARDAGLNLFYVRAAAPTPFVPGGCCVYYWSAPLPIPVPSAETPVVPAPVVPPVTTEPAPVVAPTPPAITPAPAIPTPIPATHAVTIGPGTLTPATLTPTAAQDPALVVACSAACTVTLGSSLRLGSAKTALKAQSAKLTAGHRKRLTIHLSAAQHRAIRKTLAAHKQARVVVTLRLKGQRHTGQFTYIYR